MKKTRFVPDKCPKCGNTVARKKNEQAPLCVDCQILFKK